MPQGCLAQRVCSITESWTVRYSFTLESSFWKSQTKTLLLKLVRISSCHLLFPFAIQPQTYLLHLLPHLFYLFHSLLSILIDVLFFHSTTCRNCFLRYPLCQSYFKIEWLLLSFYVEWLLFVEQWCSGKNTETWFHSWLCHPQLTVNLLVSYKTLKDWQRLKTVHIHKY